MRRTDSITSMRLTDRKYGPGGDSDGESVVLRGVLSAAVDIVWGWVFCLKTGSGAIGSSWMRAPVIECMEHVQSELVPPMSPAMHCLWRNMSQCSLEHLIAVPLIGRDRSVRHSNDIPHESQLLLGRVVRLLCVMPSS